MQSCSVPKVAQPSVAALALAWLRLKVTILAGLDLILHLLTPSSPPHPSSRGIALNQPLDQTQGENDEGDRVLLDIPYIPYMAH